jgi:hypothetical protein
LIQGLNSRECDAGTAAEAANATRRLVKIKAMVALRPTPRIVVFISVLRLTAARLLAMARKN